MKINNETIKQWGQDVAVSFTTVANSGTKSISKYDINCCDLEERYVYENILDANNFKDLFSDLKKSEGNPCVYFFEVISDISPQTIVQSMLNIEGRTKPSIKKGYPQERKILYVGKVKSLFWGRLIMHMGFHTNKKRQGQSIAHGLQLRHWATDLNLKLTLHVYTFEPEMANYMEIIERLFANELKPIIGRH